MKKSTFIILAICLFSCGKPKEEQSYKLTNLYDIVIDLTKIDFEKFRTCSDSVKVDHSADILFLLKDGSHVSINYEDLEKLLKKQP